MGRIRLNKKDRGKAAPAGTNKAIYLRGKPRSKTIRKKAQRAAEERARKQRKREGDSN